MADERCPARSDRSSALLCPPRHPPDPTAAVDLWLPGTLVFITDAHLPALQPRRRGLVPSRFPLAAGTGRGVVGLCDGMLVCS